MDIAYQRMHNQQLTQRPSQTPAEVVKALVAVQSQDYPGASWALAERIEGTITQADVDRALADGSILRTHVMRPTWHFVTPEDIRWLLMLTAPRVHTVVGSYYRKLGIDAEVIARSQAAFREALQGGRHLTRPELAAALVKAGVERAKDNFWLGFVVMHAELEAVICSGAKRGKQHTYALLDERAPSARTLTHGEAMAELTRRYFATRGPATLKDFGWWSGLTQGEIKRGIEMVRADLRCEEIGGSAYWYIDSGTPIKPPSPGVFLLPNYDEMVSAYTDRSAIFNPKNADKINRDNIIFAHFTLIDGQVRGMWKRTFHKGAAVLETNLFDPHTEAELDAIHAAAQRFGGFLEMPVQVI